MKRRKKRWVSGKERNNFIVRKSKGGGKSRRTCPKKGWTNKHKQ